MKSQAVVPSRVDNKTIQLSENQINVVECLVNGMTQKLAAKTVGVAPETVSRMLRKDHVLQHLNRRMNHRMAALAPMALNKVAQLADGAESERIMLDASFGLLDRAGYGKPDSSVRITAGDVNIHIDLR